MLVETDTLEFEQEISRLRRANHELEVRLEESSKTITELTAAKQTAATAFEATIQHLREHVAELTAQAERDKETQQKMIAEYTAKVSALQRQLNEKEKEFYLENKKAKAINSKRQSAFLVQNLAGLHPGFASGDQSFSRQETATRSRMASDSSRKQPKLGEWANERPVTNTRFVDQEMPINDRVHRWDSVKGKAPAGLAGNDLDGDRSPRIRRTPTKTDSKLPTLLDINDQRIPEADENSKSEDDSKRSDVEESPREIPRSVDLTRRGQRVSKDLADVTNPFGIQMAAIKLAQAQAGAAPGKTPASVMEQYLNMIEQLQHQLKCEESEKKQLIEECQRLQQAASHLSAELVLLHKNVVQIEEEKLEILSHAEDYHAQITSVEQKLSKAEAERTRLEARLAAHDDKKVTEEGDVELLKLKLSEAQASLTEMQITCNRLDSDLKERSMDFDSSLRRAKDTIADLNTHIASLKAENEALQQRGEDLALQLINAQHTWELERMDLQKTLAMSQFTYEGKINELEQLVKSLQEQGGQAAGDPRREKDFNDDLFSVSYVSRSAKPMANPGPTSGQSNRFSFKPADGGPKNETVAEPRHWYDDDTDSQARAKEILKRGTMVFDLAPLTEAKENDKESSNFNDQPEADRAKTKPPSKRGSVVSFGHHSFDVAVPVRRLSQAVGVDLKFGALRFNLEETKGANPLSKFANIDDLNADEHSASDTPDANEGNDRFLKLIDQLNEKSEALTQLQAEHDLLKTDLTATRNDLDLKNLSCKNLQSQLEAAERAFAQTKAQLTAELDRITAQLIQLKTRYNEVESQRDVEAMVHNKALRTKNVEIGLLRKQLDEVAGAIRRRSSAKGQG